MAKKSFKKTPDIIEDMDEFDPMQSASKLPSDITGGLTVSRDYVEIPIEQIIPFQQKEGSDFEEYSTEDWTAFVADIRLEGVVQAISVRALPNKVFEILAGEHRWRASKELGLQTITARVYRNLSDSRALRIFAATNLFKRKDSVINLIHGYYHFLRATDGRKKNDDSPDMLQDPNFTSNGNITVRQMQRYAKMNALIPEFKIALKNKELSTPAGYELAFLSEAQQKEVLPFLKQLKEEVARSLHKLAAGKFFSSKEAEEEGVPLSWNKNNIEGILSGKKKTSTSKSKLSAQTSKRIFSRIAPEFHKEIDTILDTALALYFAEHPEQQAPPAPKKNKK